MKLLFAIACSSVLALTPSAARAADKAKAGDERPAGDVDWGREVIRATGAGAPDMRATNPAQARLGAEQAAKLDALRNLITQVKGIHVSATKTVGDAMSDDTIKAKIEGVVRGYKVVDKRYFSDSGVELDVEVPLAGVAELVENAPAADAALKENASGAKPTGVVVDARGLKITPALGMRVLDGAGTAVYSQDVLSPEARKTSVAASYFKSLDEAKKSGRVGDKPLVVKAAKVDGADLVLVPEDAKKLAAINASALHEGRVAVIGNAGN